MSQLRARPIHAGVDEIMKRHARLLALCCLMPAAASALADGVGLALRLDTGAARLLVPAPLRIPSPPAVPMREGSFESRSRDHGDKNGVMPVVANPSGPAGLAAARTTLAEGRSDEARQQLAALARMAGPEHLADVATLLVLTGDASGALEVYGRLPPGRELPAGAWLGLAIALDEGGYVTQADLAYTRAAAMTADVEVRAYIEARRRLLAGLRHHIAP